MHDKLFLTDEPIKYDNRVKNRLRTYKNYMILSCNKTISKYSLFQFFIISNVLKSIICLPYYWTTLYSRYHLKPDGIFSGLRKSVYKYILAKNFSKSTLYKYDISQIKLLYANDLACGIAGNAIVDSKNGINMIYDTHEVSFHRNRKNSLLRVVFDIITEKKVIESADRIIVVNRPIKDLYMKLYKIESSKISIENNNFFPLHFQYALKHFSSNQQIGIVYVGAGIKGRMLERLTEEASASNTNLYGFFLGDTPRCTKDKHWQIGSRDYLNELLSLVKKNRLAMWCCTEDVCLSYRLSLPNKFFQAIAIGIPVIVAEGTYLADLVKEYNIGYIYNGANFDDVLELMSDDVSYKTILDSVAVFQHKIYKEKLIL